ncbi:Sodium-dependent phosphate transporter [Indibacter alkaliphilus LW1]|jgi:phosphate:Na+ symporter|uniref:Sodium-dependent phosphate transporter n=1 Tax=Indibacter alkaliphilus (strain CCUG 57479 / KCTC 22604 / LW1) TaxID=1189612 RepID=S2D475_INDAL|nr:Na/Pi symporter [Indibacter alkaliphilus]EOZ93724.1 Sodium-dependent phosphate transporter [Indibacter alkaliphilus LW1]
MEEDLFDFWKFLAGIGIFLWGMHQLENAIKELGGKSFRNLLQKSTNTAFKGILIGALITAILQSSSLVTLMVLAFLGAGVINLKNSIGVILGANLGTTITAWIVATLGFKLSVADFAMPFLGLGSLLYLFSSSRPVLKNIGAFAVGFGLLFLGLDFMKTAIEAVAEQIDLSVFHAYGLWVYLLIGIVVTALIQSSSAMVVIILSSINAGVIGLLEGAVLIIGANIGTTITVALGSLNGSADKKRLALAHTLFNVITGILIFIFIKPLISYTMHIFNIADPLMELVLLNTLINLMGIILFFPFINKLENWLQHRFMSSEPIGISKFIKNVSPKVPEIAITALEKDMQFAFDRTISFISSVWKESEEQKKQISIWRRILQQPQNLMEQYAQIKILEDELTNYHIDLQEENLSLEDAERLTSLMLTLRTLVYASKDLKDVLHNIKEMEEKEDALTQKYYHQLKQYSFEFLREIKTFLETEKIDGLHPDWIEKNAAQYNIWISNIYQDYKTYTQNFPISTMTNVLKQVVSSLDNLGSASVHFKMETRKVIDKE